MTEVVEAILKSKAAEKGTGPVNTPYDFFIFNVASTPISEWLHFKTPIKKSSPHLDQFSIFNSKILLKIQANALPLGHELS